MLPLLVLSLCHTFPPAQDARSRLLDGVREIAAPGVPGSLCVFGERAFPVVVARGKSVVAAARSGRGRVVAFGHGGYLKSAGALETGDTGRLVENAIRWAAGGKERPRVQLRGPSALAKRLAALGLETVKEPAEADVVLLTKQASKELPALLSFVEEGGGLLTAATGWGWQQLNPGKELARDFAGNKLLYPTGLAFTRETVRRTGSIGFSVGSKPSPFVQAGRALARLVETNGKGLGKAEAERISATLRTALASLPSGDATIVEPARRFLRDRAGSVLPTRERPIGARDVIQRLAAFELARSWRALRPERRPAARASRDFPGSVARNARRITRVVRVEPGLSGWTSTGLYAPPAELVTLSVRAGTDPMRGWKLRIGCHTDRLWHKPSWTRWPQIAESAPLDNGQARCANPFGGLVYVDVGRRPPRAPVEVEIQGAVEAPFYVLGETSSEDWARQRERAVAPWGELQGEHLVLSLPLQILRGLDDPAPLLSYWDRVWSAHSTLLGRSMGKRRERFVPDRQISAGFMHAGYPIMAHMRSAGRSVDLEQLEKQGSWGHFHELGHNAQQRAWTFAGTVEVTCNLFSLHAMEKIVGIAGHGGVAKARARAAAYLARGGDFERWKREPFLALEMYRQLIEAFGWDSFTRVFREYDALPKGERPRSDREKRDQWCLRFSKQVGRDLSPFFARWAVPLSPSVQEELAELEDWSGK